MSTLNELRTTLDQHAESIHDTAAHTRSASVRQRARVVRRQRLTAVTVAAVVVVVAAIAVAGNLAARPDVEPARQWHGVEVPSRVDLAAGDYELDEIRDMRPGREISYPSLEAGEVQRRAVALVASGLGDGTATLLSHGRPVVRLVDGQQLSPTLALWVLTLEVEVEDAPAGAHVGIALYDGPDTGFPERLDDGVLASSASEPDGTSAEVTVEAALDKLRLAVTCSTFDGGFTVTIDGEQVASDGQCAGLFEDGSFNTLPPFGDPGDPVEQHTIRVDVTEPGISIGAYVLGDGPVLLGQQVSATVEQDGRTWVLDHVVYQTEPGIPVSASITTGAADRLVGFVNVGGTRARISSGLDLTCRAMSTRDVSDECNPVLLAGDTYDVTVTGYVEDFEAAILVYRPE